MKLREEILQVLRDGGEHSGEALAERLGISRSAVWKTVKQLRRDGYAISAATRRGYRLDFAKDPLSLAILTAAMPGRRIVYREEIDSTNAAARQLAEAGAEAGTAVIAARQTAGRGRLGRSFSSDEGGLYMSVILRPSLGAEDAALLTAFAATAAAEAIEELVPSAPEIGIKWVNDLFCRGRKLAGILCEGALSIESGGFSYVVVGIGINLRRSAIPAELSEIAIALDEICTTVPGRAALAKAILDRLAASDAALAERRFLSEYRRRSVILGREVLVVRGDERYTAVAESIDDRGALSVLDRAGERHLLSSGEVSIRLGEAAR